jgi:hypothetical protein
MADNRFVTTQFCDDVRQELGNKVSLMGCYGHSMLVGTLPAALPKLCVQIRIYTPVQRPFTKLSVRLMREGEVLGEIQFPQDTLLAEEPNAHQSAHAQWRVTTAFIALSPFHVERPCRLNVEADTEDGLINGGSFWIDHAPSPN